MQAAAAHALHDLTKDDAGRADWCSTMSKCMKAFSRCVGTRTGATSAKSTADSSLDSGHAKSEKHELVYSALTSPISTKEALPPQPKYPQPCTVGCSDSRREALKHPEPELVPIITSQNSARQGTAGHSSSSLEVDR